MVAFGMRAFRSHAASGKNDPVRRSGRFALDEQFVQNSSQVQRSKTGRRGARADAVKEVNHAQARLKAVEKLNVGIIGDGHDKHPGVHLLRPWFDDPDLEEEYRDAAYTLQRKQITRIIAVMSVIYLCLFAVEFGRTLVDPNEEYTGYRVTYITLRVVSALSALIIAFEMRRKVLHHKSAMRMCLALVSVFALVPSLQGDVGTHTEPQPLTYATELPDESFELMSIYIIAYSMLVPIFPIRFVGTAMLALTCVQFGASLMVGFVVRSTLRELYFNLCIRELIKGTAAG